MKITYIQHNLFCKNIKLKKILLFPNNLIVFSDTEMETQVEILVT